MSGGVDPSCKPAHDHVAEVDEVVGDPARRGDAALGRDPGPNDGDRARIPGPELSCNEHERRAVVYGTQILRISGVQNRQQLGPRGLPAGDLGLDRLEAVELRCAFIE